jgi:hypothetical protein
MFEWYAVGVRRDQSSGGQMARKWTSKDILLLLLYSPGPSGRFGEPISGRTRLTKLAFLFNKEVYTTFRFNKLFDTTALPEFGAWKYGPFSRDVFVDLDFFLQIEFVESDLRGPPSASEDVAESEFWIEETDEQHDGRDVPYAEERFSLTSRGLRFCAERLWPELSDNQRGALFEFKRRYLGLPLQVLLKYVYENYPGMTSQSEILGRVLGR